MIQYIQEHDIVVAEISVRRTRVGRRTFIEKFEALVVRAISNILQSVSS